MNSLSSKTQMQASFDYQALDASRRVLVRKSAKDIKMYLRRAAKDIWKVGQSLSQVRSCLQHGQFVAWLNAEFEWTPRTAYNFINVFETFHDFEKFSKIDAAASALYLLAAPSTPSEIRAEFLKRALSGEKITGKSGVTGWSTICCICSCWESSRRSRVVGKSSHSTGKEGEGEADGLGGFGGEALKRGWDWG